MLLWWFHFISFLFFFYERRKYVSKSSYLMCAFNTCRKRERANALCAAPKWCCSFFSFWFVVFTQELLFIRLFYFILSGNFWTCIHLVPKKWNKKENEAFRGSKYMRIKKIRAQKKCILNTFLLNKIKMKWKKRRERKKNEHTPWEHNDNTERNETKSKERVLFFYSLYKL